MDIRRRLLETIKEEDFLEQVPMKLYTTFRAGGPARFLVSPEDERQLAQVLRICRECGVSYLILGRGSNLLVSDKGYDGIVVSMRKHFDQITIDRDTGIMTAMAGASMPSAASAALEAGFGGLEFASGIPGTVGGGVLMNAGAYGGEISQRLIDVRVLDEEGSVRTVSVKEAALGYRTSIFQQRRMVILSCRLLLERKDRLSIRAQMDEYNRRRREKQPLEYGSAGSTFKRPAGYFAGKLIEDAGLKGAFVGDAQVSEKHAGFVINRGNATAGQIYELCCLVQERVKEHSGVSLELEVQLAGDFGKAVSV